jgi:hypothetical protein
VIKVSIVVVLTTNDGRQGRGLSVLRSKDGHPKPAWCQHTWRAAAIAKNDLLLKQRQRKDEEQLALPLAPS